MTAEEILKKSPTANTEGLTGLAAFIAGETPPRDEEAAALTRAKVRQLIDDVRREKGIPDTAYDIGRTHWADCWRDRSHHNCAVAEIERLRYESMRLHRVLFTVAEYIDNGVRPPAHVDIDGLYARMRDAVNGWRNGRQP